MGVTGDTYASMVPNSTEDGESTENHTHGAAAGSDHGYGGSERTGRFEVIEIVDDRNPYLVLLGIDWAIDMNGVINLKKGNMIFEKKSLRVIIPRDLAEGLGYTEPVHDYESDDDLDYIYKIIAGEKY